MYVVYLKQSASTKSVFYVQVLCTYGDTRYLFRDVEPGNSEMERGPTSIERERKREEEREREEKPASTRWD
jgi:hypothetical protein